MTILMQESYWGSLLAAFCFLAAGSVLFIVIFSRFILHMEDSPNKTWTSLAALFGLTLLPAAMGWTVGVTGWLLLPGLVFLILFGTGIQLLWFHKQYRASRPVASENVTGSLLKVVTTLDLAVHRYEVTCPGLLCPRLRIAHISDLHINNVIPNDWYVQALQRVTDADPDLIFITGDFVSVPEFIPMLPALLKRLRARSGVFGVLGNHDYWVGADVVASAVEEGGVVLLGNNSMAIPVQENGPILISGCEDPWGETGWRPPDIQPGGVHLVLSHTADNVYRVSEAGCTALFTGHYHAGQIVLPLAGALVVPSRYGRRFVQGHYNVHGTDLFVTSGMGTSSPPLRVYCQPEILLVDLIQVPAKNG